MLLVIDANVAFAALINPKGTNCDLVFSPKLELIDPEFFEQELKKYFPLLQTKSGQSEQDLKIASDLILSRIKVLSSGEYESFRAEAEKISPDPKDVEYFSVALAFGCAIWSNDKKLKEQSVVKVFSTSEVLKLVKR